MSTVSAGLLATLSWLAFACVVSSSAATARADEHRDDPHSFGNPSRVRVTRVELDLTADFAAKQLRGTAILSIERRPGCPADEPLRLDTRELIITSVTAGANDSDLAAVPFELKPTAPADRFLGTLLTIQAPESAKRVRITYATAPTASALQWLDPPRTAGKTLPFLFTQSEAIHARSWIPLQDSPGVRVTYAATIHVPEGLRAVMSADQVASPESPNVFRFEMPQPIPPYLIALAVGELAFRPLGARTGVYAEPSVVKSAEYEFADTEAMVASIEKRFGPYRWNRYDLLVLPPSFPFGGMENPKLTFATPTIIAGDRSLVALVAHELAHSWSGNLVTNASWDDLWLNEGFTVYLERRIVEDLYGPERAAMEAVLGLRQLRGELHELPPSDQRLHLNLKDHDPDQAMTHIAYEKGALFLATLEQAFGRPRFDAFLRRYFEHFAFRSLTTSEFEAYLRENLLQSDAEAAKRVDVHAWLYEPGIPAGHFEPKSERLDAVERTAREWFKSQEAPESLGAKPWSFHEWLHFLQALPPELPPEKMAALDAAYHLTASGNSEIVAHWLLMAIHNHYTPADARLEAFLTTVGRRKFLKPLYSALVKTPEGKTRAKAIYAKARPFYHPIAVETIDKIVNP